MEQRQQQLLVEIVRSYVRGAEPVGSRALEGSLGVSSATIRNEMVQLEEQGYLEQPYTSAGRIPTLKAYRYYVEHVANPREPSAQEQHALKQPAALGIEHEAHLKAIAKLLAGFAGDAVVIGFEPRNVYYTGLANLFEQPEFQELAMVRTMGRTLDQLDEAMAQLYPAVGERAAVYLGAENPFGDACAVVCAAIRVGRRQSVVGILGPARMDFDANLGRIEYVRQLIAS